MEMKNPFNIRLSIFVILCLVSPGTTYGQKIDSAKVLIAERVESGKQMVIDPGVTIRYLTKSSSSEEYEKGHLAGFTDSTISIAKKKGTIVIPIKELRDPIASLKAFA